MQKEAMYLEVGSRILRKKEIKIISILYPKQAKLRMDILDYHISIFDF